MIELKPVSVPDFGIPLSRPEIPSETYARRCDRVSSKVGMDWLFVYADREHFANMAHLSGFEPRFEEAILLLGANGKRILVVGNENKDYAPISPLPELDVLLAQSLSLMGQDRSRKPNLESVLREAGIGPGQTIGVIGWKYLEEDERSGDLPAFLVPHSMIAILARIVGGDEALFDATPVLMHPEKGDRAIADVDQIAAFEWASARASAAVWRVVRGARIGMAELEAAASLGYAGEPLACHVMFSSASAPNTVIGLASPCARRLNAGDGVTAAVGYWGGLSARAGVLCDSNDEFLVVARSYFAGLLAWYDVADIGVSGGRLFDAVAGKLAEDDLRPALNPGHLVNYDEWSHSPIRPGSSDTIRSGMPFQVDVIPTPIPVGAALNCEDTVTFSDADLRQALASRHPEVWSRMAARRAFMKDELGVDLKESILPMSSIPLCLPPLWLASDRLLVKA